MNLAEWLASMEVGVLFIKQSITIPEVIEILERPQETVVSVPPQKPKGGQAFLFKAEDESKQGKISWSHDNLNGSCRVVLSGVATVLV